jgi:hypothetical protein
MELIASESSALLDLSIQQESIHEYFQPSEAACSQQPWIFANPAIEGLFLFASHGRIPPRRSIYAKVSRILGCRYLRTHGARTW